MLIKSAFPNHRTNPPKEDAALHQSIKRSSTVIQALRFNQRFPFPEKEMFLFYGLKITIIAIGFCYFLLFLRNARSEEIRIVPYQSIFFTEPRDYTGTWE